MLLYFLNTALIFKMLHWFSKCYLLQKSIEFCCGKLNRFWIGLLLNLTIAMTQVLLRQNLGKLKRIVIKRQTINTLSHNDRQRVVQRVITNENEWKWMATSGTTKDNEWISALNKLKKITISGLLFLISNYSLKTDNKHRSEIRK